MFINGKVKRLLKIIAIVGISITLLIVIVNGYISISTRNRVYKSVKEVPSAYTALVLGAHVSKQGTPSNFLKDRLDMALQLYQSKKVKRLLLSGDHGTVIYDEVNNMRNYLLERGVDTKDIFLDHAGFDTYNSIVRAKEIFGVNDMIIVSQEFHIPRALFIAGNKKLKAYGIVADKANYGSLFYLKFRERIAAMKAFLEVTIDKDPKFLGEKIPITGDSKMSYDR